MSAVPPTPDPSNPDTSRQPFKLQRVLACVLCQQRKVKCDRKFPCASCIKHQTQCVPSTQARRRRRRFPERELLDRLRKYEDILRENKIKFEPMHKDLVVGEKESPRGSYDSEDEQLEAEGAAPHKSAYEPKNIWNAMTHGLPHNEFVREQTVKKAWDQLFDNDDHILFGSRETAVDLSTLHPEPVHIFRLWQLYLDNVNPLLMVTHTPTLQGRIIQAISNLTQISPPLEALMFSVYCMAILSLAPEDCQAMFGSSRKHLLNTYQFGCQQALLNCGFLRSADRDVLTALYLYLLSNHPGTHPRSLNSMFGVAIRMAQRMGIHNSWSSTKCTVFEAEMRGRLWWSLMLFDARISELSGNKATMLDPTWDCKIPLNVNDSDLREEMKEPPTAQSRPTESLFVVLRSELADFIRNSRFQLDLANPALKRMAKDLPEGGDPGVFENRLEDEYFKHCDPENPLHFMTIWTTRGHLSKCRLLQYSLDHTSGSAQPTETQRDASMFHAFRMLESDTKLMTSPLTKGYIWLLEFYFPFPAYIHIIHDLRRRPTSNHSPHAWEVMSANYEARIGSLGLVDNLLWRMFIEVVLKAWDAIEASLKQSGESTEPPKIVASIRRKLAEMAQNAQDVDAKQAAGGMDVGMNDFLMSIPIGFENHGLGFGVGGQDGFVGTAAGGFPHVPREPPLPFNVMPPNWTPSGWGLPFT